MIFVQLIGSGTLRILIEIKSSELYLVDWSLLLLALDAV